jgi:hypothetical protein
LLQLLAFGHSVTPGRLDDVGTQERSKLPPLSWMWLGS